MPREGKLPVAMATQHPDSATKYVPVQEEPEEALFSLLPEERGGLGCDEYMVDYEGKLTPYHQTSQVVLKLILEADLQPGRDVFVTPRVPSAKEETVFRQLMSLLSVVEADVRAQEYTETSSIVEIIHPMVRRAEELVAARRRVIEIVDLAKREFGYRGEAPEIIPLVEGVPYLFSVRNLLGNYLRLSERELGDYPDYLRVFIGKSDSALSFGHVSSILACRAAISESYATGEEFGIDIYPIFGGGALPFRGHITLENIDNVLATYAGSRTITIQSGLRYDHGFDATRKLVRILRERLQKTKHREFDRDEMEEMINFAGIFSKNYVQTLYHLAPIIAKLSDLIPRMRDRLARVGPVGYSRKGPEIGELAKLCTDEDVRNVLEKLALDGSMSQFPELPRAIRFTASLYTIGIPPEIIGTGRGLKEIEERYGEEAIERILEDYCPGLEADLRVAMRYLNLSVIEGKVSEFAMRSLRRDVELIVDYVDIDLSESSPREMMHRTLSEMLKPYLLFILEGERDELIGSLARDVEIDKLVRTLIINMGKLRRSLG